MEPLSDEQKALAAASVARAERIAQRYATLFPEEGDEFKSEAYLAATLAAAKYDPEKSQSGESWVALCVARQMNALARRLKSRCRLVYGDVGDVAEPDNRDADLVERIRDAIKTLPAPEQIMCLRVYGEDAASIERVAVELGYSPKHGHKIHRNAIDSIRRNLATQH